MADVAVEAGELVEAEALISLLPQQGWPAGSALAGNARGDTGRAALINDLLDGQYANPACVVAFNIVEGWARDVTENIASELRDRCGECGEVPESLQDFLEHHGH